MNANELLFIAHAIRLAALDLNQVAFAIEEQAQALTMTESQAQAGLGDC